MKRVTLLIISFFFLASCKGGLVQLAIGTVLGAPIAVAVDTANARAYVVNSNNNVEFTGGSLSILDITDPAAPVLLASAVNPVLLPDFSGQIYFDPATKFAYVPNRLSDNNDDTADTFLRINLDESSAGFGTVETFTAGDNPFGIACCDAAGRIYVVNNGDSDFGTLDIYDPADPSTLTRISLEVTLSPSGDAVSGRNSTEGVLLGTQAFVSNRGGNIYVINTSEVGDTSKNPIDYVITGAGDSRGIVTDGTLLYVVDATRNATVLRILNPATLTPAAPDTASIAEVDADTVQTVEVAVGKEPNEVAVFGGKAYVSNKEDDTVTVIDLSNNTVAATISVGDQPFGLAAFSSGGTDYLYVTNLVGNSISIIDLGTNAVVATFAP